MSDQKIILGWISAKSSWKYQLLLHSRYSYSVPGHNLVTKSHLLCFQISSVQFNQSVMSSSLWSRELQHTRPLCPSPTPRVHSNSCASSQWCHPAISSSFVPFSSCPQSLQASEPFPVSQLFTSGGQSIGVSTLTSVLPRTPRTDLL